MLSCRKMYSYQSLFPCGIKMKNILDILDFLPNTLFIGEKNWVLIWTIIFILIFNNFQTVTEHAGAPNIAVRDLTKVWYD